MAWRRRLSGGLTLGMVRVEVGFWCGFRCGLDWIGSKWELPRRSHFQLFLLSPSNRNLRVVFSVPGRTKAYPGSDAVRRWLRRRAGSTSVDTRSLFSCVASMASWSRSSDPVGRIWCGLGFILFSAKLWWRELMQEGMNFSGISDNKVDFWWFGAPPESCSGASPICFHGGRDWVRPLVQAP